jgi:DNA mismatch repair protein MutS2
MNLYPKDTLYRFEFNQIVEILKGICKGDKAKNIAENLVPYNSIELIKPLLLQTKELLEIRNNGLFFPETFYPNIIIELKLLAVDNSILEGKQIIKLKETVETAINLLRFLEDKKELYPALRSVVGDIKISKEIVDIINKILEPNGLVKDNASKDLLEIRKELDAIKQKANRAFSIQLRKYKKLGWLREFDESFFNERRVLAVISEYKRQVKGFIHGISETGSTAFIEPSELLEVNNERFEVEEEERREVTKILNILTAQLRVYLPIIKSYEQTLSFIDFTDAKAKLAQKLNANMPVLSLDKKIKLEDSMHPLLYLQNQKEGKETIPLSIEINDENRIIIISGPNAGGKSISLKTVGLLQIMLQSGLLIPAKDYSQVSIFKNIFVDIGDDQSIEYELSTYSSRLQKMKYFIEFSSKNSIIFIDEFGTGSDPELGGFIAESILEEINKTRTFGMITTHYGNIKILAENTAGLQNACMLFDEKTLTPKYKILVGNPGSSYTFEVAKKIGLNEKIIENAKSKIDGKKIKFDELLVTLQAKKNQLNKETYNLQFEKGKLKKETEEFKKEYEKITAQNKFIERQDNLNLIQKGKLYNDLLELWQKTKSKPEILKKVIIASDKEYARQNEAIRKQREQERLQRETKNVLHKNVEKEISLALEGIKIGVKVKLKNSKQVGIVSDVKKDKITVVFGSIKTIVNIKDLREA